MLQAADKKKVTKSISDLGRRVTAADVSTKTGLPVLIVSQALNQIASETNGRMAVSQNGDLVYSFSLGFSNTYLTHGLKRILEKTVEQVLNISFSLLRISFGVMLMISFFINLFFFYMLFSSQKTQSHRKKNNENLNLKPPSNLDGVIFREAFYALTNPVRPPIKYDYRLPTVRPRDRSNFLLDCFSLLFGDGDPNEGLGEKRWQLIAKVIKQHDNVITAEQLAPYTGADPHDEDAVLPVLVRFNGKPEVTESGNIIYTFPSLAVTAGSDNQEAAPPFLQEFPCKFTEVDQSALKPIYQIAAINFFGSWFFWLLLASKVAPSLTALLTTLVVYGSLFILVPLIRFWTLDPINRRIERRNAGRASCAETLLSPGTELKKKITESREYRMRAERIGKSSIVYTTDKDSMDQEDDLSRQFKPGETIDAKPEETFDASPKD